MTLEIRELEDGDGLRIADLREHRDIAVRTGSAVAPRPVDGEAFPYPVDAAAAVTTDRLDVSRSPAIHVYDDAHDPVADVEDFARVELGPGTYLVQFDTSLKLYLRVDGPLTVDTEPGNTTVALAEPGRVLLGARRHDDRPAGTITTPGDPRDVMRALSHLGSAAMTTSPRRSYPSLRRHPPTIELGDAFDVPAAVDPPDVGIEVEVPPELAAAYVAAPLAHYLPARLVPGETPRIVTDEGVAHELDGPGGLDGAVERVLKLTFFLDCVVREEITTATTVEQRRIADSLPFAVEAVRDLPPAARLARYLSVPADSIAGLVPRWKLVADVEPTPANVEMLPYLLDDLAVVRTPTATVVSATAEARAVEAFVRGADGPTRAADGGGEPGPFVEVEEADSIEQAWVGEGIPIGASKAATAAFRNRLRREKADEDLQIVVVCNDDAMLEEGDAVGDVYGTREQLPFEVSVHEHLPRDRLRSVLAADVDFLHYVGHIDEDGFECVDGSVDARRLDSVGVDSFVLNACHSYRQGLALVRGGAIGGVVTLDEVINSGALRVGKTIARLLNLGFPLRPALRIASKRSIVGSQYLVVGDGNFDIAHNRGLAPALLEVSSRGETYDVTIHSYPTRQLGLGGLFRPTHGGPRDEWFLAGSKLVTYEFDAAGLRRCLDREVQPVLFDGELTWSDRVSLPD